MALAVLAFILAAGIILGGFAAFTYLPGMLESRRLTRRLEEVSFDGLGGEAAASQAAADSTLVKKDAVGPLPGVDRLMAGTKAGSWLQKLIQQAGSKGDPELDHLISFTCAAGAGAIAMLIGRYAFAIPIAALGASTCPFLWLVHRRTVRIRKFEEQFPEALDLLSRAIRAGHAFQTAMGMVADEVEDPVGPEFKVTFDQQNFGLPLRDALNAMPERMPLLDVRFFVTAVLIQRDTGGNLSEILDNLANVVRERFKIHRQIRVHTAHGRFTGYVLLALPACLAVALSLINPDHMAPLFHERMGQMMLMGAIVMQTVGYLWIRKVIKIEV